MSHIVLLGDSIFDNAPYVEGGPDVRTQLQERLPEEFKVTLLAVDGSTTQDVHVQLRQLPNDASHLIVSAGGNDALGHMNFLSESASFVVDVLNKPAWIGEVFQQKYHGMLADVLSGGLPTVEPRLYKNYGG